MTAETIHNKPSQINQLKAEPFYEDALIQEGSEPLDIIAEPSAADLSSIKNPEYINEEEIDELLKTGELSADDAISAYLRDVAKIPLLEPKEELRVARKMERGRLAAEELTKPSISPRRANKLLLVSDVGKKAEDTLITSNLRLVISIAKRYRDRGLPFLD